MERRRLIGDPWVFRGKKVWITKEIRKIIEDIETVEEAEEFFEEYEKVCDDPAEAIGYIAQLNDSETRIDILDLFDLPDRDYSPVFDFKINSCIGIKDPNYKPPVRKVKKGRGGSVKKARR